MRGPGVSARLTDAGGFVKPARSQVEEQQETIVVSHTFTYLLNLVRVLAALLREMSSSHPYNG